jgi:putative ABC transport system substrate-binding protein
MNRREFLTLIGGAAAWPLAARAQNSLVIGYLSNGWPESIAGAAYLAAFRKGLNESGYVEGRNLAIEYRWAEGHYDRLPELAADLVRLKVAAIVAVGAPPTALAAKNATTAIPIVFAFGGDPVRRGLVASLNRSGGNLTGVTALNTEILSKRVQLLSDAVSTGAPIALLVNPTNPIVEEQSRVVEAAARTLGRQVDILRVKAESDLDPVFATVPQLGVGGLVIAGDGLFVGKSSQIGALALRHRVPAIFQESEFAAAGGLMSYGPTVTEGRRIVGIYTGRILKGEKPADLPVQQVTKFELIINLKTARALGLTIPPGMFVIADEVIE